MKNKSILIIFTLLVVLSSSVFAVNYDYWRQDDNSSEVWIKGNFSTTSTIIYFDNETGTYAENGNNVFIFFDDFENNINYSKWQNQSTATRTISGGTFYQAGTTANTRQGLQTINTYQSNNISVYSREKYQNSATYPFSSYLTQSNTGITNDHFGIGQASADNKWLPVTVASGSGTTGASQFTPTTNTWYDYKYTKYTGHVIGYYNQIMTYDLTTNIPTFTTGYFLLGGLVGNTGNAWNTEYDYVFITKWNSVEPTVVCTSTFCNITMSSGSVTDYQVKLAINDGGNLKLTTTASSNVTNFEITAHSDYFGTTIQNFTAYIHNSTNITAKADNLLQIGVTNPNNINDSDYNTFATIPAGVNHIAATFFKKYANTTYILEYKDELGIFNITVPERCHRYIDADFLIFDWGENPYSQHDNPEVAYNSSKTYLNCLYQTTASGTDYAIPLKSWVGNKSLYNVRIYNIKSDYYNTTNGTIVTNLLSNATTLYNMTIGSYDYFSRIFYDQNVSTDKSASLSQSNITFFVKETFSNAAITNFYITLNGTFAINTTGNNQSIALDEEKYTGRVFDNAGAEIYHTINQNFSVYPLQFKDVTFNAHPHEIFVYAYDISTNATVTNFTINIYSLNITDNRTNSTTTGVINFDAIHNTYNITITDADGYAITSPDGSFTGWQLLDVTSAQQNWTVIFYLYTYNSVNFTWRDENTNLKVPGTIINFTIIDLSSSTTVVQNSTNTSTYYVDLLAPNSYEIQYGGQFYNDRSYFFTVSNKSTQQITLYVKNSSTTTLYFVRVADETDRDVIGATVRLQKYFVNQSQFITVEEGITNEDGETDFYIEESSSIYYRFIILVNGSIVKTTTQQHILTLSGETKRITIYVDLGTSIFQAFEDINSIFYTFDLNRTDNISYFSFIDSNNEITKGCIIAKRRNIFDSAFTTLASTCHVGTSGDLKLSVASYIANNTVVRVEGHIYYTDLEVLLDYDEISTVVRGTNTDDNDGLLFTAIAFIIIAFAVLMIPNLMIQIIIDIGLLFGLAYFKFNLFPSSFIILLLILGIIINWNRRTTRDGNIQ